MLTKEETLFSPLLGLLMCLRSTLAQSPTKSVKFCRICDFLKLVLKVKVKVKFTLEPATKAQRGRRGIDLLFL
jgi:hypothetical protein